MPCPGVRSITHTSRCPPNILGPPLTKAIGLDRISMLVNIKSFENQIFNFYRDFLNGKFVESYAARPFAVAPGAGALPG